MAGTASLDATVSVNGQLVVMDQSGNFETVLLLEEGANLIEVIASDLAGDVRTLNSIAILARQEQEGLFGRVTNATTPSLGLTVITLAATEGGVREIEAAENTAVSIPGRARASAADISPGDFVAVLASASGGRLEAINILVKPQAPVVHTHVTGSVIGALGDQLRFMDRDGNVIVADVIAGGRSIPPAQVVTAVLSQDLKAGSLSILGAESADTKIARLTRILETAIQVGTRESEGNLKERLKASTTGHISTLQEILNRTGPEIRVFIAPALDDALEGHRALLADFGLGSPTTKVAGIIEAVAEARDIIFVSPSEGSEVQLRLADTTIIRRIGEVVPAANLEPGGDIGQRIEAVYDPRNNQALTVDVIFPLLRENLVGSLLAQVMSDELEGTVSEINPPVVVIGLAAGKSVTLATGPETRIRIREESAELQDLVRGASVKVRYDPAKMEALEIETFDVGQTFISGVVKGIIRKIGRNIPGSAEAGNIFIETLEGETLTLNVTETSAVERDGLRLNIDVVSVGDLVRPTSRYNAATRGVQKLALKSPGPLGTIRGKGTTPSGRDFLTISTDELSLLSVTVNDATEVIRSGAPSNFATLEVGERVASGVYSPFTLRASQLVVQPTTILRATGPIAVVNREKGIVTLTPEGSEPIELLVPDKPGFVTKDGEPAVTADLNTGDKVQVAFYRPDKAVVWIVVTSQE